MKDAIVYITIAAVVCLFVIVASPANATPPNWPHSEFSSTQDVVVIPRTVRKVRPRKKKRTVKKRKKAIAAARFESLNGFVCCKPVTVTGQVKATEKRAQDSAWSQYHSSIKFSLGEKFADERFARDVRWQCIRSRSESLVAKTVDAVGGSVNRFRCSMTARPCQPPRE